MIPYKLLISITLLIQVLHCECSNEQWDPSDLPREISDEDESLAESQANHKWSDKHYSNFSLSSNHSSKDTLDVHGLVNQTETKFNGSEWTGNAVQPANNTNGRSGRELDLDALISGSTRHHEPGERESRILNDPPNGPLSIQGFIPILGLGAGTASGSSSASMIQQSFLKHTSHVPHHQHHSYGKQTGSAITQRLQALASSLSPINKLNRRRYQAPSSGPMVSTIDYAQFAQQCTCVPFYMCKAGYIEQERSNGPMINQYGPIMRINPSSSPSLPSSAVSSDIPMSPSQLAAALLSQSEQINQAAQSQIHNHYATQQRNPSASSDSLQSMYPNAHGDSNTNTPSSSNPDLELPIDERSVDGSDRTSLNPDSSFNQSDIELLGRMLGFGNNANNLFKSNNQCGVLRTCCPLLSASELSNAQQQMSQSSGASIITNQYVQGNPSMDHQYNPINAGSVVNAYPSAPATMSNAPMVNVPMSAPFGHYPPTTANIPAMLPSPYGFPTKPTEYYTQTKIMSNTNLQPNWKDVSISSPINVHRSRAAGYSVRPDNSFDSAVNVHRWQSASGNAQCGIRPQFGNQARVLNHQAGPAGATEFGEFPWQAALLKRLGPADSLFVCGATLIGSDWVATAAHCIKKNTAEQLKVRLGEYDVHRDDEFYPHLERNVMEIIKHPQFYPGTLANDIALLRLEPLSVVDAQKSNPHIVPACLPYPGENFAGQRCWVAGWGKDAFGPKGDYQSVLRKVDVPVIGHAQCNARLCQTRLGPLFDLHAGFMCAGGEAGKDACEGDGGSALVCEVNGVWKAAGLVSWGLGCGKAGIPGVYVNVGHYSRWIEHVISSSMMASSVITADHVHHHSHHPSLIHSMDLGSLQRQGSNMDERGGTMGAVDPASIINERSNGNSDELVIDSSDNTNLSKEQSNSVSTTSTSTMATTQS